MLITGSSKGLGKELALKFAQQGYNLIIHGRDTQALEATKKEIMQKGVDCKIVIGDLKSNTTLDKLAEIAKKEDISILINNAGLGEKSALEKAEDSYIEDVFITNLVSLIKLTKRIYIHFLEKGKGTIININSISGLENKERGSIYRASKCGLRGFSDNLRLEAEKNNIRVLTSSPRSPHPE